MPGRAARAPDDIMRLITEVMGLLG